MDLRAIIEEIESNENKQRKAEHEKRFRVYNDYQREYVLKALTNEFSAQTVSEMRTFTSLNLTKKIIDELSSLYKRKPQRTFEGLSESQIEGVEKIYQEAKVDTFLKRANQKYKLHQQCAIQVLPKDGHIVLRLLAPFQYDVIPQSDNPEEAFAYIISSYDKTFADSDLGSNTDVQGHYYGSKNQAKSDSRNQQIADEDDWKEKSKIYVIWTAQETMKVRANGEVIERIPNPIGMLPFIDVAAEKDFEFWIRRGSGVCEFNIDFLTVLSDSVNTNRLQSYAQPVIVAEKIPESVTVGPQNILFLPLDPTRPEIRPSFEFASPNPDLKASLELQDKLISYFLSASGLSSSAITGNQGTEKFSSGLERLLSMIDRFSASEADADLFISVEDQLFKIIRAWYDVISGTETLEDEYNFGAWPMDSEVIVKFMGPEVVKTEADKEDSVIKRLEAGLISRIEAIAEIRGISLEDAQGIVASIDGSTNMEA